VRFGTPLTYAGDQAEDAATVRDSLEHAVRALLKETPEPDKQRTS
jgi:hypothetical protein